MFIRDRVKDELINHNLKNTGSIVCVGAISPMKAFLTGPNLKKDRGAVLGSSLAGVNVRCFSRISTDSDHCIEPLVSLTYATCDINCEALNSSNEQEIYACHYSNEGGGLDVRPVIQTP